MRTLRAAFAALAFTCVQAQAPGDLRIALVIGNAAYPAPATLSNPANDARAVGDTLRGLGFQVIEVRDATRGQMLEAVRQAGETLRGKQGIGMLYYAGHGLQLDWRNYMVPVDAKLTNAADVPPQTVELAAVVDAFKAAGNRMNIVVLDACRDNPFTGASPAKGLAQLDAPPGTILAYATAPGNVAEDGSGSNGLYTQFLLQELVKPQSKIEDVFKRTRFAVRKASGGRQIPWESTSLEDDFMFNAGKVVAVPRPDSRARDAAFRQEKADWDAIAASRNADDLFAFLAKYPSGNYSEIAQSRLERLQKAAIVAQPAQGANAQASALGRYRPGDRYEYVFKDGLTGVEQSRGSTFTRQVGEDEFEVVGTNMYSVKVNAAGLVHADGVGRFEPPWASLPATELQVGKRLAGRSQFHAFDGTRMWADYETRITAREKLQTAIGEIETYRSEVDMLFQNGTRRRMTFWFDPDWGGAVKMVIEVRRGSGPPAITVREMLARSRQ